MIKVVHIANNAAYADNPITKAFRDEGYWVYEFDFINLLYQKKYKPKQLVQDVISICESNAVNFIFMQIQHGGIIEYEDACYMSQVCPVISYSGDVHNNTTWHEHMGAAGALTLLNNDEDINRLRSFDYKADYLQISFHNEIHNPKHRINATEENLGDIVFIGNYTDEYVFPLSKERYDLCVKLKKEFGDSFSIYGNRWNTVGLPSFYVETHENSQLYSRYNIAINHSHYQRGGYTSDRLFYILASGTFCMTHWYPRIEEEFIDGEHLIVYRSIEELIDKCKWWLKPENKNLRDAIALNGCRYVHNNCTWNHRIKQLNKIIPKHFPKAMEKNDNWIHTLYKIAPLKAPQKTYSQFGEESFIGHIFNSVGAKNKFFVDLGAGNGVFLSNTKLFKDVYGWSGLMIDADNGGNDEVKQSFITSENVLNLLEQSNVPSDFDFLSIDLDGNDYHILSTILTKYKPSLIVAEFNGTIPNGECRTIEYNPTHIWNNDDYYGASFDAFKMLGKANGYSTIFSFASTNIYLLNNELLAEPDKDWGVSYQPMQYHPHNPNGKWLSV